MDVQITGVHRRDASGSKWVVLWWRSRDKSQCIGNGNKTSKLNEPTLWAKVLGIFSQTPAPRRPFEHGETCSVPPEAWLLIARRVGMRNVADAFKWSNS